MSGRSLCGLWAMCMGLIPLGASAQEAREAWGSELRSLAERVGPAVVALDARMQPQTMTEVLDAQARASGFLISEDGHLLTDARLLGERDRVDVHLAGGLRGRARRVGADPRTGVALLVLENPAALAERMGGRLPKLELGSAWGLRPGDSVVTVGNTFESITIDGVPSFSWGAVATVTRFRDGVYRGVAIETDAAVNPGCYGAPLLDRRGRVVGVVTHEHSGRRFLGLAVPIDPVKLALSDLRAGQVPGAGRLGLGLQSGGGRAQRDGLAVAEVDPSGPAAEAGVQVGDRLVSIDGAKVWDMSDAARELSELPAGNPVRLRVQRGGSEQELVVVLGRTTPAAVAQAPTRVAPQQDPVRRASGRATLGLQLDESDGKLVVVAVQPGGPCAGDDVDVRVGDALLQVGEARVGSYAELGAALGQCRPGQRVELRLERNGWMERVQVVLGGSGGGEATPAPQPGQPGFLGILIDREDEGPGVLLENTTVGSPAEAADLRPGDRIVAIDGQRVSGTNDLVRLLGGRSVGETVRLQVRRNGRLLMKSVALGVRPEGRPQPTPRESTPGPAPTPTPTPTPTPGPEQGGRPYLGVGLEFGGGQVTITELDPAGIAARQGWASGDVILEINGAAVRDRASFERALYGLRAGQRGTFRLERGDGWTKTFEFVLPAGR